MRTAVFLFAFVAVGTLCGAAFTGCGSSPRVVVDMSQKSDMAIFFPGCDNNAIDSGETDVDCGGPCDKKCAEGQMCKAKTDCATGVCVLGTCQSATICSDNITNGDETDLDCGGSCPPCGFGKNCTKPGDCASNICTSNACAPLKAGVTAGKGRLIGISPLNVEVGDFDGDGKVDIAALSGQDPDDLSKALSIALGKGDGTFNNPIAIANVPAAEGPYTLAVGDLDKDGKSDIVYTNAGNIVTLLNDTNAMTPAGMIAFKKEVKTLLGSDPGWPQLVDLDGDGKLELVHCDTSYDSTANGHHIYLSAYQDGGKWKMVRRLFTGDDRPTSPVIADFDDDHFPDVAALAGGNVVVFIQKRDMPNTINAFLPMKTSMTGMLTVPTQIVAAELDNPPDFRVDVVVLARGASAYGVMAGAGDGTLLKPTKIDVQTGPAMMALVDYDIDGKWDVATANYDTDTAGLWLGQGNRSFMQGPMASAMASPTYIIARDVNGDKKPDLVTANPGNDMVVILINKSM